MQLITRILDKKINLLFYGIICLFLIIIVRLSYFQIHLNEKLFSLSTKNFTRIKKIMSPRGNITDSQNHILATNRPVTNIYWQGTGNKTLSNNQISLLNSLEKIINKDFSESEDFKKIKSAERYSKITLLENDISFGQLSKIMEQFPDSNNIMIETKFQRFYPHKTLASHIVGYLSQIDSVTVGKMGLEKIFEEDLRGKSGELLSTINSLGKSLTTSQVKPVVPGRNLVTTIDFHIQKIAEDVFPQDYKGAFIIMDPETGAIKAIVSRPNFDPSAFLKQLSTEEWNDLQDTKPFLNRAFNASYPPASPFKLVTISAALELGIVEQDSKWFCQGFMNFGNRNYFCAKKHNHGLITTKEAVAQSCNTFFYNIARKLHIDHIAEYAKKFGLGKKTGIIFAEKSGLIPSTTWKLATLGDQWWPGETLSVAIGQSYLLATPIQMAKMISGIFTGYLVNPRILQDEEINRQPLNIRKETLEFLRQSMKTVVMSGTGQRVSKIKDITIYAKTGTAQTSSLEKRDLGFEHLEHAWFVSNFAYKNQKSLTMVILIEHAGSTIIPITAAKIFLIEYRKLMNLNNNN